MTLCVVLDALSWNALRKIDGGGDHIGTIRGAVVPPFSFEPDAAFHSGRFPEETDSGTHFWYDPHHSPFKEVTSWGKIADRLPWFLQLGLRRWMRWHIAQRASGKDIKRHVSMARIPFQFLPYFDIVQKSAPFKHEFCPFPTIFDLLRSVDKRWVYLGTPVSSARSEDVWEALQQAHIKDVSFVFLFAGDLDGIGHRYGPDSVEYADGLHKIGNFLRDVLAHIHRRVGTTKTLIFGDHGMVEVTRLVDVQAVLERLSVRPIEDYVYFLDSTLARFWFFNERARQVVTEAMQTLEGGRLITEADRIEYRIRYPHNRFGEVIWWADGGTLILPNFWQGRKPVKGMHGYRREVTDNQAGFLLVDPDLDGSKILKEPLEMVDVFATMVELLGLEISEGAYGTSVYRRIT